MKLKSVRTKLLIFFLLVGLVPLIGGGVLNVTRARQNLQEEISNKLTLFAEAKEGQIFAYLDSLESRTVDFSSDGFIRDSLKEIVKKSSTQAVGDLNEHLRNNKQVLDSTLAGISVVDLKGKVVASTSDEEMGKNESNDKYFIKGQKGVFTVELTDHAHFGLVTSIIVSAPLTDKASGELLGVLVNFFKTDKLSAVLSGELQKEGGAISSDPDRIETLEVYLVGPDKEMIVHPSSSGKETAHTTGMKVDTLPVQVCFNNNKETAAIYSNYGQKEVIGASMCLPNKGWVLLVEVPTKDAFASITRSEFEQAGLGALLIIVVILTAVLFAAGLVGPIKILHEATEVIARGNLGYRVEIKTGDEIEQLGNAFNEMAGKLQESYAGLEEKVREKTKDLVVKIEDLGKANKSRAATERAMLNILEDARELEEELANEKTGVEKKVVERTRELAEEQARLVASIKGLSLGFMLTDNQNKIILTNPAVSRIFGFGDQKWTIADIEKLLAPGFDFLASCAKCKAEKKTVDVRDIVLGPNFLRIFLAPVVMTHDHEEVIGMVILVEDITEAKILERSRDEFFSIASHELRTPLTAIKGNTSMILDYFADQLKDRQMKEMIDDVHESSIRLIEIVNDFLDTSRLELGKMQFEKGILNLSQLIPNVIKQYQVTSSRKKLYIHFEDQEKQPPVVGDQDRFRQVLINLIGNGLKFTKEGGVTVTLKNMGKFIKVLVSDTGMGIPKDNQKLLFRKFQQAESNIFTRDTTRGTGLGLYISKLMVDGMGGSVQLESSVVGKGTTFSFTLPVATDADIADFAAGPAMNTNKSDVDTGGVKK